MGQFLKYTIVVFLLLLLAAISIPKLSATREDAVRAAALNAAFYDRGTPYPVSNSESYADMSEQPFKEVRTSPLSTFSTDVDTASYSNVRRLLNAGQVPPKGAVRLEEFINYFTYDYREPEDAHPLNIHLRVGDTLWNDETKVIQIALQAKSVQADELPPGNLVFLLDVSGSMRSPNKLPLLKTSLMLLINQLRSEDKVSIVVYAGAAGLVLDQTAGNEKEKIIRALDRLEAGGSTAGGAGIELAYKVAQEARIPGGNNRVILATDGDFNVGVTNQSDLVDLIERKRKSGIYLTVLGFGMGNYKDDKMESLADKGNGNYAYIDNLSEAQKVLVTEMSGTLHTIAKDVKVQVEFNPAKVTAYRLIGYENRALADEDFNNDQKDAAEIGMGHSVTALYEIKPKTDTQPDAGSVDPLKYQTTVPTPAAVETDELATIKIRYKHPDSNVSIRMNKTVTEGIDEISDADFHFVQAVASFAMVLRHSAYVGALTYQDIIDTAERNRGKDPEGYRSEFIRTVQTAQKMHKIMDQ